MATLFIIFYFFHFRGCDGTLVGNRTCGARWFFISVFSAAIACGVLMIFLPKWLDSWMDKSEKNQVIFAFATIIFLLLSGLIPLWISFNVSR